MNATMQQYIDLHRRLKGQPREVHEREHRALTARLRGNPSGIGMDTGKLLLIGGAVVGAIVLVKHQNAQKQQAAAAATQAQHTFNQYRPFGA